ncbi:MAG: D-alanine--D-alanine ligase [Gammaproteobacteria bacterium]|nr:D-alanine--D-alanine ligase [Gammaproteobacteria bacterium]
MVDVKKFGRVAVLMGGSGAEREVSLKSGKGVLTALLEQGVDAFALDTQDIDRLRKLDFDRAYIVLHGGNGENGEIQGFLKTLNIPFTGCDVLACAVTMDKIISKRIWRDVGLPVLPWVEIKSLSEKDNVIKALGLPLALKPPAEGSSFGVSKVKTKEAFEAAYELARKYDEVVLAEPWVIGREFAVPVIDGEVFPIVEIVPSGKHEFFDYEAKYTDSNTQFPCPCDISEDLRSSMNEIALLAYKVTNCTGMVRVDFKTDEKENPWLFEINTVPGYTSTSLVPRSTKVAGLDFHGLVMRVLESTL